MTHAMSDRLRRLADDLDLYSGLSTGDDLRRAVGVELATLGAEIMVDGRREDIDTITLKLPDSPLSATATFVVTEEAARPPRLLHRLRTWRR